MSVNVFNVYFMRKLWTNACADECSIVCCVCVVHTKTYSETSQSTLSDINEMTQCYVFG